MTSWFRDDGAVRTDDRPERHAIRLVSIFVHRGRKFSIGSGLTEAERESPPPVGTVITYRFRGLTAKGLPRFPTYLRIRRD
jgi:DNA ligase 1